MRELQVVSHIILAGTWWEVLISVATAMSAGERLARKEEMSGLEKKRTTSLALGTGREGGRKRGRERGRKGGRKRGREEEREGEREGGRDEGFVIRPTYDRGGVSLSQNSWQHSSVERGNENVGSREPDPTAHPMNRLRSGLMARARSTDATLAPPSKVAKKMR